MFRSSWRGALCLVLTSALAAGCSDDSKPVDAAPGDASVDAPVDAAVDGSVEAAVDASTDATPDAGIQSLTFLVYTPGLYGAADKPVDKAWVAFDMPDGTRIEKQAGVDGKVTFEGIDWTAGSACATASLQGYDMYSECGLSPARIAKLPPWSLDNGAVKLALYELSSPASPATVTVSGKAKNLTNPTQRYVVNVLRSEVGTAWQGKGNQSFTVQVPKGKDFVLQAVEADQATNLPSGLGFQAKTYKVMQKAFTALSQDTTGVELDFAADAVTTQTADITVGLPARVDSPLLAAYPNCFVCNGESTYCNGWSTSTEIVPATNLLKASLVWAAPSWATEVQTYCYAYNTSTEDVSYIYENGYPKAGALGSPMLDVPRWKTPASAGTPHPLYSPIEWELFDQGVEVLLNVYKDGNIVWAIALGEDATSATAPKPPSQLDATTFFGSQPLEMRVFTYVPTTGGVWFDFGRATGSQPRDFTP